MKNIIVAEDDSYLSEIVAVKLHEVGYAVTRINDGDAVIPAVKEKLPALLLLDIDLPNRDGFSILKDIRQLPDFETLPVIIFTNTDSPEIQEQTKALNAAYFLKALTGSGELVTKIQEIIQ